MIKVYTALATTDSLDRYVFVFKNKPDRMEVIDKVMDIESGPENREFYENTTSIRIQETVLLD